MLLRYFWALCIVLIVVVQVFFFDHKLEVGQAVRNLLPPNSGPLFEILRVEVAPLDIALQFGGDDVGGALFELTAALRSLSH